MRYHLLSHNNTNFVKVGDRVKQYQTKISSIGTANGQYHSHLHHSISEGLTFEELRRYVDGWSKDKVQKYYVNPATVVDYTKMFGRKMDVGNLGYSWLQSYGEGFHPGQDINGTGGGNTDIGYEYTSPCNGKVVYVSNIVTKDGWGKMVIIEEDNTTSTNPNIEIVDEHEIKEIVKAAKNYLKVDAGTRINKSEDEKIAKEIKRLFNETQELEKMLDVKDVLVRGMQQELSEYRRTVDLQRETIGDLERTLSKYQSPTLPSTNEESKSPTRSFSELVEAIKNLFRNV